MPKSPKLGPLDDTSFLNKNSSQETEPQMPEIAMLSFDLLLSSLLLCLMIREILILVLPDELAGPGGSFIDTGPE